MFGQCFERKKTHPEYRSNIAIIPFPAGNPEEILFCLKTLLSVLPIFMASLTLDHQCWELVCYKNPSLSCQVVIEGSFCAGEMNLFANTGGDFSFSCNIWMLAELQSLQVKLELPNAPQPLAEASFLAGKSKPAKIWSKGICLQRAHRPELCSSTL